VKRTGNEEELGLWSLDMHDQPNDGSTILNTPAGVSAKRMRRRLMRSRPGLLDLLASPRWRARFFQYRPFSHASRIFVIQMSLIQFPAGWAHYPRSFCAKAGRQFLGRVIPAAVHTVRTFPVRAFFYGTHCRDAIIFISITAARSVAPLSVEGGFLSLQRALIAL
jgi:hypothetical protein